MAIDDDLPPGDPAEMETDDKDEKDKKKKEEKDKEKEKPAKKQPLEGEIEVVKV